jgi:hypothetical protein
MVGRLHIYYSQNKNFFRATFQRKCAKSAHFPLRKLLSLCAKLLSCRAKLYGTAQHFIEPRNTLLNRAKRFILCKISLGMATVVALPLPIISVFSTVDLQPTQLRQGKVLIENLLPSTVLSNRNQEYVLRPLWQQAS